MITLLWPPHTPESSMPRLWQREPDGRLRAWYRGKDELAECLVAMLESRGQGERVKFEDVPDYLEGKRILAVVWRTHPQKKTLMPCLLVRPAEAKGGSS